MEQTDYSEVSVRSPLDYGHGPKAWLNDIEIGKTAYLLAFPLLVFSMFLVVQPFFTLIATQGVSMDFALHEIGKLYTFEVWSIVLSCVAFFRSWFQ